jgi:hypothetical protein
MPAAAARWRVAGGGGAARAARASRVYYMGLYQQMLLSLLFMTLLAELQSLINGAMEDAGLTCALQTAVRGCHQHAIEEAAGRGPQQAGIEK